jgi:hypothetical protein
MSIGNMNYVRKHYPAEIADISENFDELLKRFREENPRSQNAKAGYLQVALETHTSRNRTAWHGVQAKKDSKGNVSIWPMSFYGGYAYIFL